MEKIKIEDWAQYKNIVLSRNLTPRWFLWDRYNIYAEDGIFLFIVILEDSGDINDFETNYRNNWNAQLEHRDPSGIVRVHNSARPSDQATYFSGAGDADGVGNGPKLIFNLLATDISKSVVIVFDEGVYIKEGIIIFNNAPLGSCVNLEILDRYDILVSCYGNRIPLLGNGRLDINSEDSVFIPGGYKIKVTINNSDGSGDEDAAAAFKVSGTLEMYRATTI